MRTEKWVLSLGAIAAGLLVGACSSETNREIAGSVPPPGPTPATGISAASRPSVRELDPSLCPGFPFACWWEVVPARGEALRIVFKWANFVLLPTGMPVELETLRSSGERVSLRELRLGGRGRNGWPSSAYVEYDPAWDGFVLRIETRGIDAPYRYSFLIVDGLVVREWQKSLP
jgi:hypothetical protein